MEILRRSPMLAVLAALVTGLALYGRAGVLAFILGVLALFLAVMLSSYEWELPEQWQMLAFMAVFVMLCSWRVYSVVSEPQPQPLTLHNETGTITELRQWGRTYAHVIDTEHNGRLVAFLPFAEYMTGTRIQFSGTTRAFKRASRPGGFDEFRFWNGRGVTACVSLLEVTELPRKWSISLLRHELSRKLTIYMPNLTASYLKAAWLGERDKSLNDHHRRCGTSHLLVVSGFHAGIVIMCASFFFGVSPVILSLILWFYVLLTGAVPSTIRAALMVQVWLLAKVIGRRANAVNSVCTAGVLLLLWRPFLFWDIGWRLSVLSALTISAMSQAGFRWFTISPAIWLVTFPQVSYTFGSVPVVGAILNLFAPMFFAVAFTVSSFGAFLRLIGLPLSRYFMLAVEGIFVLWEKVADVFLEVIPQVIGWNYLTAWLSCGVITFFVCRYLELAPLRTAAVMGVIGFMAFMVFL